MKTVNIEWLLSVFVSPFNLHNSSIEAVMRTLVYRGENHTHTYTHTHTQ